MHSVAKSIMGVLRRGDKEYQKFSEAEKAFRQAYLDAVNREKGNATDTNVEQRKSVRKDVVKEMEAIIAKAKADGTYMKAPNGKPSNLSPTQWAMVRTKAFKKWFGDWELAFKKNFLLNGKAVSSLNGDEFGKKEGVSFKEQVIAYFEAQGGLAKSIFGDVILDARGVKNSMGHGLSRMKSSAFASVKDVLEKGIVIMPMDYYHVHGKKQQTGMIAAPVMIDGKRYICVVEVIRNKKDNRLYTHEVTLQEKLLDVRSNPSQSQSEIPATNQGVLAKVLQKIVTDKENCSKVVDKNGEPRVVYHGTPGGRFSVFGEQEGNSDAYTRNGMYFFTASPVVADGYSTKSHYKDDGTNDKDGHRDMTIDASEIEIHERRDRYSKNPDKVIGYEAYYNGEYIPDSDAKSREDAMKKAMKSVARNYYPADSRVFEAFMNLRNPYIVDAENGNWRNVQYPSKEELTNRGHDGVVIENVDDSAIAVRREISTDYIALEPTQIKSATDNIGTFDGNNPDIRYHLRKGANAPELTNEERSLRDGLIDVLTKAGIDVITDVEEGQRVLDRANGEARMQAKKRALETASLSEESERSLTVVSSAYGAKVLKNIDAVIQLLENSPTQPKTFVGDVANALGATRHNSKSEYATFETKNGRIVTIRLADHNAKVSNFDRRGELDGISIVVSPKKSEGITNDGDAHVEEYYYDAIKLRRAEGKPLADIVRSIKQALYSGEFEDVTGLAERQEVNADDLRLQKVYHGSGADFDAFDHSHMGEGEGAQAYGWGTYVTSVNGIAVDYAEVNDNSLRRSKLESDINRLKESLPFRRGDARREGEEELKRLEEELSRFEGWKSVLYTVEIPDDNGENYLHWEKIPNEKVKGKIINALKEFFRPDISIYRQDFERSSKSNLSDEQFLDLQVENILFSTFKGKEIYERLSREFGEDEIASKFLAQDAGIVGISYPSKFHIGGRYDGPRNYVIFKEADAKITGKVRFFRTADGHAYGFTIGGKIYLDPRIASAETPIHEYAHLWSSALREINPKEWKNIVELMKGTSVWDEVNRLYTELRTDDEIADEVLAQYSGRRGAERLRKEMDALQKSDSSITEKAASVIAIRNIRKALNDFWHNVARLLGIRYTSADDVADSILRDMLKGKKPVSFTDLKSAGVRYYANKEDVGIASKAKTNVEQRKSIRQSAEEAVSAYKEEAERPKPLMSAIRHSIRGGKRNVPIDPFVEGWDSIISSDAFKLEETSFDSLKAIEEFQRYMTGNKDVPDYLNAHRALMVLSSVNKAQMDMFAGTYVENLRKAIEEMVGTAEMNKGFYAEDGALAELDRFLKAQHGLERNRDMRVRAKLSEIYNDKIAEAKYRLVSSRFLQNHYWLEG